MINPVKVGSGWVGLKIGRPEFGRTFPADFLGALVLEPDLDDPERKSDFGGESVDGRPARKRFGDEDFPEDGEVRVRDARPLPASFLGHRIISGKVRGLEMRILKLKGKTVFERLLPKRSSCPQIF